ncbi:MULTISPECIES: low affinity iron permease family protein [unclassified Sinorhizobium]|uniref:low affinity iron permease family protein n=1 Tax=unclassified Sinorhizobium TaxID=2613772 RepID=UPI0024C3DD5E|nr:MULTISPECIES: low affinity iron permease family protein [unclassified Sinorhizobium]MDK1373505.1 low affinity iron permease family protein [Sinorhizobium sp. 6-70]
MRLEHARSATGGAVHARKRIFRNPIPALAVAFSMIRDPIRRSLSVLAAATARPAAFLVVIAYGVLWLILEPETFDMHSLATLIVWVMTLIIQRAEHGDTQAIHAKLDGLLHSDHRAPDGLAEIDDAEPEDIEDARQKNS